MITTTMGGEILQVINVQEHKTMDINNGESNASVGLKIDFTPKSDKSKILVFASLSLRARTDDQHKAITLKVKGGHDEIKTFIPTYIGNHDHHLTSGSINGMLNNCDSVEVLIDNHTGWYAEVSKDYPTRSLTIMEVI